MLSHMQSAEKTAVSVCDQLVGRSCHFCETGTLVAAEYKGNDAVVCPDCGTPAVQFW